jgi:hypothetical protein
MAQGGAICLQTGADASPERDFSRLMQGDTEARSSVLLMSGMPCSVYLITVVLTFGCLVSGMCDSPGLLLCPPL